VIDLFPHMRFVNIMIRWSKYDVIVTRFENVATNLLKIYEH